MVQCRFSKTFPYNQTKTQISKTRSLSQEKNINIKMTSVACYTSVDVAELYPEMSPWDATNKTLTLTIHIAVNQDKVPS